MVAFPEFNREFSGPPLHDDSGHEMPCHGDDHGLLRLGLRLTGAGLLIAALGLWAVPSHDADPAMMLIKLLFAVGLFWAGTLALHAARRPDTRPEVIIDRAAREMRVFTPSVDAVPQVAVHRLDDLRELSLRDGLLSARDSSGRLVVSFAVTGGKRNERALRKALAGTL